MSGKPIQREGDLNDAGAPIVSAGQGTVYLNGKLVAVDGAVVAGHGKKAHRAANTVSSAATVFVEGKMVTVAGDTDTCGHTRIDGSTDASAG